MGAWGACRPTKGEEKMTETRIPYLAVNDHDIQELRRFIDWTKYAFRDDVRRRERLLAEYERLNADNKRLQMALDMTVRSLTAFDKSKEL